MRIEIDKEYDSINDLLNKLFNNIQFPNLEKYILYINMNKLRNMKRIEKKFKNDYNYINSFVIDTLIFKFSLKSFFNLANQLTNIKYIVLNFQIFDFIYERRKDKKYLKLNIENENEFKKYYLNYDLLIDNKEIMNYEKIKIKGLNTINYNLEQIEEIIENDNSNICDINLSIGLKKYFIKSFNDIKSIYCEKEIQKTNLKKLINNKELNNLKYINITIGYIKELYKDIYLSDDYKYLFELIKNSKNLKYLILRIQSYNFNDDISFIISLIKDLKRLKFVNITISNNIQFEFSLETLFNKFPKLKKRIYYYEEFKINNIGFERKINNIEINKKYLNRIICIYNIKEINEPIQILNDKTNGDKNNYILYLNNKKVNFNFKYKFSQKGKYVIKIILNQLLKYMSCMFNKCSSLISLNLSNFNTINVNNMNGMFNKCSLLTSLNLSNFNTINVKDMNCMFQLCSSLENLNLSS